MTKYATPKKRGDVNTMLIVGRRRSHHGEDKEPGVGRSQAVDGLPEWEEAWRAPERLVQDAL